MLIKLNEENWK